MDATEQAPEAGRYGNWNLRKLNFGTDNQDQSQFSKDSFGIIIFETIPSWNWLSMPNPNVSGALRPCEFKQIM